MVKLGSYPIWSTHEGYFKSFDIKNTPLYNEISDKIASISLPASSSLYMRGSIVEEFKPHPKSDVDIILIQSSEKSQEIIKILHSELSYLNRPIEIHPMTMNEINSNPTFELLLHTRAKHLSGLKIDFNPILANFETMSSHYNTYRAYMINDILVGNEQQRVCELKQITRSFGIVNFLLLGEFSRDIYTCIQWAKRIDKKAGELLELFWLQLNERVPLPKMDTRYIKQILWKTSNDAAKDYKITHT